MFGSSKPYASLGWTVKFKVIAGGNPTLSRLLAINYGIAV